MWETQDSKLFAPHRQKKRRSLISVRSMTSGSYSTSESGMTVYRTISLAWIRIALSRLYVANNAHDSLTNR
jgi:hypothetical protein